MKKNSIHTFVICAYKESPYLKTCIKSLKLQTVKSEIIMVTSTENSYIKKIASDFDIPLYINNNESGIVQDWNFGYSKCTTPYITIAHQDDVYYPEYAYEAIHALKNSKNPLLFFSNYCEIKKDTVINNNMLLKIKRIMLFPLNIRALSKSIFVRRRILSLGSPICCPAVTYSAKNLPSPVFTIGFRSCEDWEAWERISRLKGEFLYNKKILMAHRIHQESETSKIINDQTRNKEDYIMFCKFWPKWIAFLLAKIYKLSEKSNAF